MKKILLYFAVSYIIFCVFISIFTQYIILDKTKDCNTQIIERPLMSPGYKECFNEIKIVEKSTGSALRKFFQGKDEIIKWIPIGNESSTNLRCLIFWFGTDKFGRDLFSRVFLGLRYTLVISFVSVAISMILGILLGLMSGYFKGIIDQIISMMISIFWSLPSVLLAFAIIFAFGKNFTSIFLAIALTIWGDVARLIRGLTLQIKEQQFILACKSIGMSDLKILFKHILPNLTGPILVLFSTNFSLAVLLESGLSFLGLGLQPPTPTLGNIMQEQYAYLITGKPIHSIIPAFIVILLILSFQIITNYLRDKTDVRKS